MKNAAALSILETILANEQEDPMVRHEVSNLFMYRCMNSASRVHIA
jgi:hypothetical protein